MVHAILLNASIYITSGDWISKFIMEFNAENIKFKKLRRGQPLGEDYWAQ